jgi:hypothetical protein
MILASYNVENLLQRAIAINQDSMAVGRDVLGNVAKLNGVLSKAKYTKIDVTNINKTAAPPECSPR